MGAGEITDDIFHSPPRIFQIVTMGNTCTLYKCIVLTVPPDDTTIAEVFGDSDVTVGEPILLLALKI
jgi:hypothetical protein